MSIPTPAFYHFLSPGVDDVAVGVLFAARGQFHACVAVVLLRFDSKISLQTSLRMDTVENTTPAAGAAMEVKDDTDSFTKVKSKKTQKRKREQDGAGMDTEEPVASKRPQFPPISGDKLRVSTIRVYMSCVGLNQI